MIHLLAASIFLPNFFRNSQSESVIPVEFIGGDVSTTSGLQGERKQRKKDLTKTLKDSRLNLKSQSESNDEVLNQSVSEALSIPESESGTSIGAGDFSAGSPLQKYISYLVRRIDEVKIYPESAVFRGEEGVVTVMIHVHSDGTILHVRLFESCPFESLNHAALDTVARIKKLPALPSGGRQELSIRIPLHFNLHEK